jgi:hypothetical protein
MSDHVGFSGSLGVLLISMIFLEDWADMVTCSMKADSNSSFLTACEGEEGDDIEKAWSEVRG